ncbi:flagellar hook-basal body complex protein FliE [Sphingorhabdus sp.]|jgi:flagellar hook-basal body complex protein FliE|uniref:flagellar hook-basal body complex protein FliE n=1 Tax=Sphingorhabdus sp. TaxID=1902408 RepID=UPI0035B062F3
MTPIDQNRLLQMRSAILSQNQALQRAAGLDAPQSAIDATSFTQTLSDAVRAVDQQQARASDLSAAYERGETHDIVNVMIERQKASLGFEATLQVRNKLLSAYRDIMNMPV